MTQAARPASEWRWQGLAGLHAVAPLFPPATRCFFTTPLIGCHTHTLPPRQ